MKKFYHYNHDSLTFVEKRQTFLSMLKKCMLIILASITFFVLYYIAFSQLFTTPQEDKIEDSNLALSKAYTHINQRYKQLAEEIKYLQQLDQDIYRSIFETDPPVIFAPNQNSTIANIDNINIIQLSAETTKKIDILQQRITQQTKILKDITNYQNHENLFYLPSMQPVKNQDMRYIATTYGVRIHPFYKVLKMHSGIDFSVPIETPIYATATGVVEDISVNLRSTGLGVTINHNNGYKTKYYHLKQALVRVGKKVQRDELIGLSGSSGRTIVPILHYEIWHNDTTCNPVHYFFGDLDHNAYQKLGIIVANKGQSMD
ncbi:peptidase [Bacteroidia bacterium]|nr:peptidase [Bacteroidia bacterium]